MKKDKILIIVFMALLGSSALVLYRGFSSESFSVIDTPASSNDVIAKSQVDAVKVKITKAINKIDTGGPLDALIESQQFKELFLIEGQDATDLPIQVLSTTTIGLYGRSNPFIPPVHATTTDKTKQPTSR